MAMGHQLLFGIGTLSLSLLLDIIGTAIPYWWRAVKLIDSANIGLFQECYSNVLGTHCRIYESDSAPDFLKATQAMMILSILALVAALGLAALFAFVLKDNNIVAVLSSLMAGLGALLAIIGVIIFGVKIPDYVSTGGFHAGFGLAIVAAMAAIPGAVIMILSRNRF